MPNHPSIEWTCPSCGGARVHAFGEGYKCLWNDCPSARDASTEPLWTIEMRNALTGPPMTPEEREEYKANPPEVAKKTGYVRYDQATGQLVPCEGPKRPTRSPDDFKEKP